MLLCVDSGLGPSPSFWGASLNASCQRGLLETNSSNFWLSISHSLLKDSLIILLVHGVPCWFFFLSALEISHSFLPYSSLACMVSERKSNTILILDFPHLFFLWFTSRLLLIFCSLNRTIVLFCFTIGPARLFSELLGCVLPSRPWLPSRFLSLWLFCTLNICLSVDFLLFVRLLHSEFPDLWFGIYH